LTGGVSRSECREPQLSADQALANAAKFTAPRP